MASASPTRTKLTSEIYRQTPRLQTDEPPHRESGAPVDHRHPFCRASERSAQRHIGYVMPQLATLGNRRSLSAWIVPDLLFPRRTRRTRRTSPCSCQGRSATYGEAKRHGTRNPAEPPQYSSGPWDADRRSRTRCPRVGTGSICAGILRDSVWRAPGGGPAV